MINAFKFSFFLCFFLVINFYFSPETMALVDYSNNSMDEESQSGTLLGEREIKKRVRKKFKRKENKSSYSFLDMGVSYDAIVIKEKGKKGNIDKINFDFSFDTKKAFFAGLNYWQASSSQKWISEEGSFQGGNPRPLVGIHWLNLGTTSDKIFLDLYMALSIGVKSTLGSSRTDTIIGMKSKKKVDIITMEIGGELGLPGNPSDPQERSIGLISSFHLGTKIDISYDIGFSVDLKLNHVKKAKTSEKHLLALEKDHTFTSLIPKLDLTVAPNVLVFLGARLKLGQTENVDQLVEARLFQYDGPVGNQFFTGIAVSI